MLLRPGLEALSQALHRRWSIACSPGLDVLHRAFDQLLKVSAHFFLQAGWELLFFFSAQSFVDPLLEKSSVLHFLEEARSVAYHFTRCLVASTSHHRVDESVLVLGQRYVSGLSARHILRIARTRRV